MSTFLVSISPCQVDQKKVQLAPKFCKNEYILSFSIVVAGNCIRVTHFTCFQFLGARCQKEPVFSVLFSQSKKSNKTFLTHLNISWVKEEVHWIAFRQKKIETIKKDLLNTCVSLHTGRLLQETMAKREMRFRKRQIAARRKMFAAFSGSGNWCYCLSENIF